LKSVNSDSYVKAFDDAKYITRPEFSFEEVGGYNETKEKLKNLANLIKNSIETNFVGNILFYGPEGIGKSSLAAAFTHECGAGLKLFDDPGFYDCTAWGRISWEEAIRRSFSVAKRNKPFVILFEKFDILLKGRPKIRFQILSELREKHGGIVVIAETDNIHLIDDELLSEFNHQIEVTLPNREERKEIIKIHLKRFFSKIEYREKIIDYLADETEEFSGMEIVKMMEKALYDLIEEEYKSKTPNDRLILKRKHLEWALNNVWASKVAH
jgi:SpoVK/Ycf46/Vps4 family AAA+-type ATPase